jgi:GNAT superfamily N-acetyltransferase
VCAAPIGQGRRAVRGWAPGRLRARRLGGGIAYLADVYVLPRLRGRGLDTALVAAAIEEGDLAHCRWLLHTADAHELYRHFGFAEPDDPTLMQRPAP